MAARLAILDYGAGNFRSVHQAFSYLGAEVELISDPDPLHGFSHLILPGVGSFRRAMHLLQQRGLDQALHQQVLAGVPLLGICLGMQLLARRSSEDGETNGLALIDADVDRFAFNTAHTNLKIPHVGFDSVIPNENSILMQGFCAEADFYFTHSYRMLCNDQKVIAATSYHGEPYVSAVEIGNVVGTQFHPEKSQANGLTLLRNFLDLF